MFQQGVQVLLRQCAQVWLVGIKAQHDWRLHRIGNTEVTKQSGAAMLLQTFVPHLINALDIRLQYTAHWQLALQAHIHRPL